MKHKKQIYLLVFIILILLFFLYPSVGSFFSKTQIYYIPEFNLYVKTILKPRNKYGTVLFGDKPDISFSDSTDYINVYYNISNSVLINPNRKDTIWFYNQIAHNKPNEDEYTILNKAKDIHQKKYIIIDGINETDTLFFHKRYMTNPIAIKKPYIGITITENFNYILVKRDSTTVRLEPFR